MSGKLETQDIQAWLSAVHSELRFTRYVFLQMGEVTRAKAWLRELWKLKEVTTLGDLDQSSDKKKTDTALHIAFTAAGLMHLGLESQVVDSFLPQFVEGMPRDCQSLGDTGDSAPTRWDFGGTDAEGKPKKEIHIVLVLFTSGESKHKRLTKFHKHHSKRYKGYGLREAFIQDASVGESRPDGSYVEPFGFRDGIAQPNIEGTPLHPWQTSPIKAGEFILGYKNEYGEMPFTPSVPAEQDPQHVLPPLKDSPERKDLGRNGTYLVLRKLRQDVRAFNLFLEKHGKALEGAPSGKELLAAKMMGRWRSGVPLVMSPDKDNLRLAEDYAHINTFTYQEDPHGLRCPISSHVRRCNPRDGLHKNPKKSLRFANRHLIIRRGRPYRDSDSEQGTLFVALNANIQRQFEFIQQTWVNNPKFGGHYDSRDPILGENHDPNRKSSCPMAHSVTIPGEPVRQRITGLPRFVRVQGGGYFFLPGIRALRFLASEPSAAQAP